MIVIRSKNVVLPDGVKSASLFIQDGRIVSVDAYDASITAGAEIVDVGSLHVMPGMEKR